ncbi:MAG: recombinase A [Kofleriaceae bacterium]
MSRETLSFLAAARGLSLVTPGDAGIGVASTEVPRLCRDQLAGRLVELSAQGASATLTTAVGILHEVQQLGEPAAWIGPRSTSFFPPDLAARGIDLDALIVVRTEPVAGSPPILRAAERLLRSGGFGLVILDGGRTLELPMAAQGRLAGLSQQHDAIVLCLTEKPADAASLGSMVSLRIEALRRRDGERWFATMRALKDKRRGPGWHQDVALRGRPLG